MQPSARMIIFEVLRKGDSFALPFRKTFSSARFSYARKMHKHELRSLAAEYAEPPRKKYLIVGLGNLDLPQTRHSVGMQVLDRLANCLHTDFATKKGCCGCVATASLDGIDLVLLKPSVPMNVNGTSVKQTDDLDSRLGKLSVKEKGSAGGHNGVRSVIDSLHTDNVTRVKIGIDRPDSRSQVSKHVLGKFVPAEQKVIEEAILDSIVKLAEHLGERTGADTRRILQEIDHVKQIRKMRSLV